MLLKPWCSLCSALLYFFQEYLRYLTFDVLEPLWLNLEEDIRRATSIDNVMECHG